MRKIIFFQSSYKQSTGCKTSTVHGHGYLSKRPTMIDAANQKNIELQEEVVRLNEKLANQEAESERRLEEKLQQFKEEESNKLQALREEFMAALAGSRGTPLVQVKNYLDIDIPMMVLECDLISSFHYLFICRLPQKASTQVKLRQQLRKVLLIFQLQMCAKPEQFR
jgi:hypothetical protein